MEMAYIATSPEGDIYAICSANPEYFEATAAELKQWKKDGAQIELLPRDEAKQRFINCLPKGHQPSLFGAA